MEDILHPCIATVIHSTPLLVKLCAFNFIAMLPQAAYVELMAIIIVFAIAQYECFGAWSKQYEPLVLNLCTKWTESTSNSNNMSSGLVKEYN